MVNGWPDPRAARNDAEFVASLRALRTRAGLSFRALERNAERVGDVLPTSTISAALSRDKLPRADLVAAYVRAAGGDDATVDAWLAARTDLATGVHAVGEPIPEPPPRRSRAAVFGAVGAVLVLAAAVATVLLLTDEPPAPAPRKTPDYVTVQITLAHSGLCVGEGPERPETDSRIVLGQYDCAEASPPISLDPTAGGAFRIFLHSPEHGRGCATVDDGGAGRELLLAGAYCEDDLLNQRFVFEPVTTPVAGYRIHSAAAPDLCIGAYLDSSAPGVQLIQNQCNGLDHQVFIGASDLLPD
jgi:hypothetical protein